MNLNEVLGGGGGMWGLGGAGVYNLAGPGTMISTQVVQPRTLQADMPEQDRDYEKIKNKQKEQHKIEVDQYNNREVDELTNYYDRDNRIQELAKKVNQTFFELEKDPEIKLPQNFTQFAKKLNIELNSNINRRKD